MTAADDRKVLMTVLVDLNSLDSVKAESARWSKTERMFEKQIPATVDKFHAILRDGVTSGGINTQQLNDAVIELCYLYQDYGVAFATAKSLDTFATWLEVTDEQEQRDRL
jgi:hypothetical protein